MFALLILYTACYIMQYSIPFLTRSAVGAGALLIELQRMTLNDRIILREQSSSSAAAANDNVEGATNSVGMIVDGQNLRSLVRDAILSSSPTTSSNTGAAAAADDDEDNNLVDAKQDQNATPIEMMEEDAAEQARKYFGVL